MPDPTAQYLGLLAILLDQAGMAMELMRDPRTAHLLSDAEVQQFKQEHPGAHLVVGDFEIKCLCPEKYHLNRL